MCSIGDQAAKRGHPGGVWAGMRSQSPGDVRMISMELKRLAQGVKPNDQLRHFKKDRTEGFKCS